MLSDLIPQASYLVSGEIPMAPALADDDEAREQLVTHMQFVLWRLSGSGTGAGMRYSLR